jgi:hypothetical protein
MARFSVSATMNAATVNGTPTVASVGGTQDASGNTATVAANVATLVADGASPTQAHVTTLNTNWGALLNMITPTNKDVILSFDASVITTRTALRQAVAALLATIESGVGGLNP